MSSQNGLASAFAAIHEHAVNGREERTMPAAQPAAPPVVARPRWFARNWRAANQWVSGADPLTQCAIGSLVGIGLGIAVNVALRIGIAAIAPRRS